MKPCLSPPKPLPLFSATLQHHCSALHCVFGATTKNTSTIKQAKTRLNVVNQINLCIYPGTELTGHHTQISPQTEMASYVVVVTFFFSNISSYSYPSDTATSQIFYINKPWFYWIGIQSYGSVFKHTTYLTQKTTMLAARVFS